MPDRHSDQERWEIYLLQIILATRRFFFMAGLILLIYSSAAFFAYPIVSLVGFVLTLFILSLVFSYTAALYTARFGAWLATFGR